MEYVPLNSATNKVFDGFVQAGNQLALKFKDGTFAVVTAVDYSLDVTQPLIAEDDHLVTLGLLTTNERNQRKAKREKDAKDAVEAHERQLLAVLKAKYETPGGDPKVKR